jgi:hypothetical protein
VGAHAFLRVGQSIQLLLEGSSLLSIRYKISIHTNGILVSCSAVFPDVPGIIWKGCRFGVEVQTVWPEQIGKYL